MLLINELEYAFSCTYSYMFYIKKHAKIGKPSYSANEIIVH